MGQICVDKAYRGKGVFELLYQKHREIFEKSYDFIVTEISTRNTRSLRAHEKVGFKTIHTYRDSMDEWNVVVWDWREEV
jgi:L-amino acid N-acyltransferase YncA